MIVGLDAPTARQVTIAGRSYGKLRFPLREVGALLDLLRQKGATITADGPESLSITGMESRNVDIIAAQAGLTLYELATQRASLKDAFMELTHEHGEFRAATPTPAAMPSGNRNRWWARATVEGRGR
jgi:ABC-2 type transport system ATP-binding protein